ncbi:hypothetical protein FH972_011150 [Carpinus fangiana]|uniref:Uncharacterized protein n=1 Tax=Carpinus fangiana TaxID=176857 RepID=A0A660KWJ6_9ROSI|nr:hypothetical protein FH972_011150 [Carpinus fangiana]
MSQSKQNPIKFPSQTLAHRLVHDSHPTHRSFTSHISLYRSHSNSHAPSPNPNPTRSAILKWFSSLTVHQRQAHLTAVDSKKSRGLVSRVAESNRLIFDSSRLFSSAEGEDVTACSCSIESVDAVTVSEELVEDLERFVGAMDGISNGGFLRGDESELGSDWLELEWLKAKGYYSLEAFVVNRLEVALRLAWLNCNGGRRRGVKLKEKASVAGVVANVYWRKKGCVDWWANLDATTRRKVLTVALGKSAKALIPEILKGATSGLEDETRLFSAGADRRVKYNYTSTSVVNAFSSLLVLKDIIMIILSCQNSEYDTGKLFFSTLGSVCTISDCILRKLRGFLMVVSLDCTKLELLGEGIEKSLPNKSKEKLSACSRRKKGRSRNMKKDLDCAIAHKEKGNLVDLKKVPNGSQEKKNMPEKWLLEIKAQTAARKSWKDKNKNKKSRFNNTVEVGNFERRVMEESSFSVVSQDEAAKSGRASDSPTTHNATDDNTIGNNLFAKKKNYNGTCCSTSGLHSMSLVICSSRSILLFFSGIGPRRNPFRRNPSEPICADTSSSLPSSSVDVPTSEASATQSIQGDYVKGSRERFCHIGSENSLSKNVVENQTLPSRLETLNCNGIPLAVPALEFDNVLSNEDINIQNSAHQSMYNIQDEDKNK